MSGVWYYGWRTSDVQIKASGDTNTGSERGHNEDAYGIYPERLLYMVADGLGGHLGGEVASRLAVELISDNLISNYFILREARSNIVNAVKLANRRIIQEAGKDDNLSGMGTTVVVVKLVNDRALIAHIGDSRAYLIREGEITQMTRDHTVVEEYIRAGLLTIEEAAYNPNRYVLSRALGTSGDAEVEISDMQIRPGDTLLLCTDGLTNMLSEKDILRDVVELMPSPENITERLINHANRNGGIDNITVITVCVTE